MKNFKQIAFGLLVGALALSFSAFTAPQKLSGNWYLLKSSIGNIPPSDPQAQVFTSYDASTQQADQPDCGGSTNVCAAEFANGTGPSDTPTDFSLRDN